MSRISQAFGTVIAPPSSDNTVLRPVCPVRAVLLLLFFFSSRRRHTRCGRDWSSDVCSSDLIWNEPNLGFRFWQQRAVLLRLLARLPEPKPEVRLVPDLVRGQGAAKRRGRRACEIGRASCRERVQSPGGWRAVKREARSGQRT